MKTKLPIIVVMTLLAILDGGVVLCAQKQPPNLGEVRKKIKPADEIWSEYQKLKYEMTPAGRAERERKEAEEVERLRKEAEAKAERDRQEAEAKAERDRKEAEAKAERDRKEAEAKAERERILAEQRVAEEKNQLKRYYESQSKEIQEEYNRIKPEIPSADEVKQLYEYIRQKANEIRSQYDPIITGKPTLDEVKQARTSIQSKFDEIQVEFDIIREKIAVAEEAKRIAEIAEAERLAELKRIDDERRKPVDLKEELKKSGFSDHTRYNISDSTHWYCLGEDLSNFLQYGSDRLKDKLSEAKKAADRVPSNNFNGQREAQAIIDAVQVEIRAAKEEIARKTFVIEYGYTTSEAKEHPGESSFKMRISTIFFDRMVNQVKVEFPVQNVKVFSGFSDRGFGMPYIELFITGSADSIQVLLRDSNQYRARVRFNNLRYDSSDNRKIADVLSLDIIKAQ